MNYKFPYKAHFQRSAVAYLGIIALLTTGYVFLVRGKSALKKYQKFNVFVTCAKVDVEPFKEKIGEYVDKEVVESIVVNCVNPSLTSYYTMYSTFGLEDADVLIMEKKAIYETDLKTHFISFDASSAFYSQAIYAYEGVRYGLAVNKEKNGCLGEFISFEEEGEYYLFVNKKSEHLKQLGENGRSASVISFLKGVYDGQE